MNPSTFWFSSFGMSCLEWLQWWCYYHQLLLEVRLPVSMGPHSYALIDDALAPPLLSGFHTHYDPHIANTFYEPIKDKSMTGVWNYTRSCSIIANIGVHNSNSVSSCLLTMPAPKITGCGVGHKKHRFCFWSNKKHRLSKVFLHRWSPNFHTQVLGPGI